MSMSVQTEVTTVLSSVTTLTAHLPVHVGVGTHSLVKAEAAMVRIEYLLHAAIDSILLLALTIIIISRHTSHITVRYFLPPCN